MDLFDDFGDRFRNLTDNPGQTLLKLGLGAINPYLGIAGVHAIDLYNDWNGKRQLAKSAEGATDRLRAQGERASRSAMDRPLDGPLGQFDKSGLASALLNARSPGGGWNMSYGFGPPINRWQDQDPNSILRMLSGGQFPYLTGDISWGSR